MESPTEKLLAEAAAGNISGVLAAIAAGADTHALHSNALRLAVANGHVELVHALMKAGVGVDDVLMVAARHELIKTRARPNGVDGGDRLGLATATASGKDVGMPSRTPRVADDRPIATVAEPASKRPMVDRRCCCTLVCLTASA